MDDLLTEAELRQLATIARQAVVAAVREGGRRLQPDAAQFTPALRRPGAVFVTLRRDGMLRGCIGTLEPMPTLVEAVADRARAAALHDPRFAPVGIDELTGLEVSVSVLTRPHPIDVGNYEQLRQQLHPGIDGVVVQAGRNVATFLPSVWDELPAVDDFLEALWRKAGLPHRAWPPGIVVSCYTAQHSVAD